MYTNNRKCEKTTICEQKRHINGTTQRFLFQRPYDDSYFIALHLHEEDSVFDTLKLEGILKYTFTFRKETGCNFTPRKVDS